jgi:hypothetical protein
MDMSGYPMFSLNRSAKSVVKAVVWGAFKFTTDLGESGCFSKKSAKSVVKADFWG